jgi:hypothetical protein
MVAMSDPSLALQTAIRARLIADPAVTALVPAAHILDRHARPEVFPCVNIGEGFSTFADRFDTFHDRPFTDLHIWDKAASLGTVKAITGAVCAALRDGPWQVDGYHCPYLRVTNARYLRDPKGEHSHVVVTVEAILQETAA